jgi:hypothetical protein
MELGWTTRQKEWLNSLSRKERDTLTDKKRWLKFLTLRKEPTVMLKDPYTGRWYKP